LYAFIADAVFGLEEWKMIFVPSGEKNAPPS
jgi:hypothetical protein